ncbi:LOW QUALITY PROTEIN: transcription initiation factor TFIID subunit 1 [Phoenix dactylifera]|uniref:Transcription initiation factor TFIID subunit 1 n=1 Tax=Phoenix dactylifera TaxID=42345 RepID=A0A8B7CTS5_PHODC|nr:LOW QUALITY PROTEIN: transcription initiation factor TFIID subunit 1 [Phoenix dactylifera]
MSRDDNEDDDYEEFGGGNRFLGFMFGNVDNSGDLDIDYLDEDAKEHLAALADKLGPSLTDIDLIKSSPGAPDASEQDYDEKAEDAVDYEDIDEQYDGPEVQAGTEEDHLLPKKDFFSSNVSLASLSNKASVFDEENYDEDEETVKDNEVDGNDVDVQICPSADEQLELISSVEISPDDNLPSVASSEPEQMIPELEDFQEHAIDEQKQMESKSGTSLPILCIDNGVVILRFSEIFGVHEPKKQAERKDQHRHSVNKEWLKPLDVADIVEEDEEAFLRSTSQDLSTVKLFNSAIDDVEGNVKQEISGVAEQLKDSCLSAQPMKENITIDMFSGQRSPLCPNFYPLDQQDWEDAINWGNSPTASHGCSESCMLSELDVEVPNDAEFEEGSRCRNTEPDENDCNLPGDHILVEPFGSRNFLDSPCNQSAEKSYHPQLLRLECLSKKDGLYSEEVEAENGTAEVCKGDVLRRLIKLSLQNKELSEGSWLDQIIWDPDEAIPKPKLILDLQDDQMLFEVLDNKDGEHLRSHAGAMVITHSSKSSKEDSIDLHSQGSSASRFNISNDKYYSNRKSSQQAKSHAKKHAFLGIKVMHSVPALKLQTMKPKLSNKELANFHRPKALWYPHHNKVAAMIQGAPCTHGPMKIILMSMGGKGKGTKLTVNAEETLLSFKQRASKKLDFKLSEKVKVYYSGRELEEDMSLAEQQVRPNSVLQLVRTRIHVWPRAQKLPGENKPLRPPGAFKKKSELSVKDGHVFLMEYCEERPLLLGNVGMGARLCTYYQKTAPSDLTASSLRNGNEGLGTVLTLDPADRSPFLGDIGPGCSQSCLETNMYRAPVFPHKLSSTDYLLVRSAKGMLSLRRIDKLYVVGQQEPHMEVLSPGSKNVQTYLANRMIVHVYREFRANDKPDFLPYIRADELAALFPSLTDAFVRKRLKHCADLKKGKNGQLMWGRRRDFRIPSEEELRRMLTPENVCSYESMQAGLYRLKRLGISRLTQNVGLSSAMNQLPDEAISLAAASHIERELQITPWNLTSNFVACTNQGRENIERLEITGVGDPSGRGLGFSYVRVTPKAPISNAVVKKKAAAARGGPTVTGTDADLRRLSMDAAREVLLKFKVPEERIDKLTRWHRIAMVRKLSSEQAASGVKVDAMTLSKFARGQRMSFLQLQQQTREKCHEIWDRQVQSLSAADVDESDSDPEANSDLDSFAGDLENLLVAEECEDDDGTTDLRGDKADGVRGLKMRRCPSQAQTEEEIEDDEAEAVIIRRLLEDDGADIKKKRTKLNGVEVGHGSHLDPANAECTKKINTVVGQIVSTPNPDGSFTSKELMTQKPKEVEIFFAERSLSGKVKPKKGNGVNDDVSGLVNKKSASVKDGLKVFKEKKQHDKPVRENFVCGACGQLGHMRTNKNCPKYGEDAETSELESVSGKSNLPDAATQLQVKTPNKKLVPKMLAKVADAEVPESVERAGLKLPTKILPVKFKCGPAEKPCEKNLSGIHTSDKQIVDAEGANKPSGKINKIIISNKSNSGDVQNEIQKSSVLIRLPVDTEKEQSRKKIIIKQPKVNTNVEQVNSATDTGIDHDFRKIKKITELSSFEKKKNQESQWFTEETSKRNLIYDRRLWDEEEKRKNKERIVEEKTSRMLQEERRMQEEHRLFEARRYPEAFRREERTKKKKKKKKHDFRDEYLLDHRPYRNDRRIPERDRAAKRRPMADADQTEYAPLTKRRRGGEVELSNILESILDSLKETIEISYLFLKPVTKKEAPDYLDIIKRPMDLSTIREKVRNMEYKSREDFRHDVWQIAYNAHKYNDGRNPGIPPLADQLLELCDYHLEQKHHMLSDAEAGIEFRDM